MNDADALLAAVCADADDDLARMAYADCLEENGQTERAEFIRLQLGLAQLPADHPEAGTLRARAQLLMTKNSRNWTWDVRSCGLVYPKFERGFIMAGQMDVEQFLRRAERLFAMIPLRHLTLLGNLDKLSQLELCHLRPLYTLRLRRLGPSYESIPIASLINRGLLDHLRILDFTGCPVATGHFRRLLTRETLRLSELGLAGCGLNALDLTCLFIHGDRLYTKGLQVLDLRDNQFNGPWFLQLIQCSALRQLRWLRLEGNLITNQDLEQLCNLHLLPHLTHLTCDVNQLDLAVLTLARGRIGHVGNLPN